MELTAEMAFLFGLVGLFFVKVFDNILLTSKTIFVQKNKSLLAALAVTLSQIIFYKLIDAINTTGDVAMYVVSVASGVGTFLALGISNRFSKERTFVNIIMSDDKEEMMLLITFLRKHKLTNLVTDSYREDWSKTLAVVALAQTKKQSKLIDEYLASRDIKFKRVVQKA